MVDAAPAQLGLAQRARASKQLQQSVGGDHVATKPFSGGQRSLNVVSPDHATEKEAEEVGRRVAAGEPTPTISAMMPTGNPARVALRSQDDLVAPEPVATQSEPVALAPIETVSAKEQPAQASRATQDVSAKERPVQEQSQDAPAATAPLQREALPETSRSKDDQVSAKQVGTGAKSGLANQLQASQGQGETLPENLQAFYGSKLNADFSRVRVHTDANADQLSRSINARAFTRGNDVFFSDGTYDPASAAGKELIAHELTHVVQQGAAPRTDHSSPVAASTASVTQRQRATTNDDFEEPTEAQKAAAKAAAERATKLAMRAAGEGSAEVAKSNKKAKDEKAAGQEAKQVVVANKTEKKAKKEKKSKAKRRRGKKPALEPAGEGGLSENRAPTSPEEDPSFQTVVGKIRNAAKKQQQHEPASVKADQAQKAAESPAKEIEGKAQTGQVGQMEQAETPAFDGKAFKAQLMDRIKELTPKTVSEADDFKQNNRLGAVKDDMQGKAAEQKAASQSPLEQSAAAEPDTGSVEPRPVTPLAEVNAGPPPTGTGASQAAPKQRLSGEIEAPIQQNTQRVGGELENAGVCESTLAHANEPTFTTALESKQQAESHASQGPQEFRQSEGKQLGQAETEATGTAGQRTAGMHTDRAGLLAQVHGLQGETKGRDEQSRDKVGQDIQTIFDRTKTRVDEILEALDGKVAKEFDTGSAAAKKVFEDYVDARMEAYKEERYGGWFGWARWGKDKLLGMPNEVNVFYEEGRKLYLSKMDAVIDSVVAVIGAELTAAKAEVAKGKKEIQSYVDTLPENLKSVGAEAAEGVQTKFDELESSVDAKQGELIDTLANKYRENVAAVDARIEELKAANAGLVEQAFNAVVGVIKTILEIKNLLLTVLSGIASVVTDIIADPIGFLGNLIKGLKQGFESFVANIASHLQKGMIAWLTGSLGSIGIQLPENPFSLKGIFSLVGQVLGITWDFVRGKAVKLMGEPVVKFMETAFEPFKILITEGIGGLWNYVKEQFTNLKEMVMEQIKSMLITQVIKAGIKWLIGLLNPAAAFIKAATTIYEIVSFLWDRAKQILDFINGIVEAIAAIAKGSIGGAAKKVEESLAKALPLVIGFLANLLGIGGLAKKVQDFIKSLRKKFSKAIDKLILKAKKVAKKLFKGRKPHAGEDPDHAKRVAAGLAAIDKEEEQASKGGKISRKDAERIVVKVKRQHRVFERLDVIDGNDSWDYRYVASPPQTKEGPRKSNKSDGQFKPGQQILVMFEGNWELGSVLRIETDNDQIVWFLIESGKKRGLRYGVPNTRLMNEKSLFAEFDPSMKGKGKGRRYQSIPDPADVGPFKRFSADQKRKIIALNRESEPLAGEITSDDEVGGSVLVLKPAKKREKGGRVDPLEVQIDHVFPMSKGGWNSNSNAAVLSAKQNRSKLDIIPKDLWDKQQDR